jgi:ketosteroid isomerase-like protein
VPSRAERNCNKVNSKCSQALTLAPWPGKILCPLIKANLETVESHFHNEALNEIEKVCELYTEDIVCGAGSSLIFRNKQDVIDNYRKMFASSKDVEFRGLQRFATEDRVVDDSVARFKVVGPYSVPVPIGSEVEMRLVHIFEMRDGKITKEVAFETWKVM